MEKWTVETQPANRKAMVVVTVAVALCVLSIVGSAMIGSVFAGAAEARFVAWTLITVCWVAIAFHFVSRSSSRGM